MNLKCEDCGLSGFIDVVKVWCFICEPVLRCEACHLAHKEHVGVVLRQRGEDGPVYVRVEAAGTTGTR